MTRARTVAAALLAALLGWLLAAPVETRAQSCTWGGTSSEPAPVATPLRAYARFWRAPGRVALGPAGRLFVADPSSGAVLVLDEFGRLVSRRPGLARPLGIAVNAAGLVYVGEEGSGSVAVFDDHWTLLYKLGVGDGEFALPNHIAVDPDPLLGLVYVADSGANEVRIYSPDGALVRRFGGAGQAPGQLDFPTGIFVSASGEIFVADQNNDRVQVFDRSGVFLRCFGRRSTSSFTRRFGRVQGVTGDSRGRIYVADAFQGHVRVFDRLGVLLGAISGFGDGPGRVQLPGGLAIDERSRLFVTSAGTGKVELFGLDEFTDAALVPAVVAFRPERVRRPKPDKDGEGKWLRAIIELAGADPGAIDPRTVAANGMPCDPARTSLGDADHDGVPDLLVRFDPGVLLAVLPDGESQLVIDGELLDGTPFEGYGNLTVVPKRAERGAAPEGS